MKYHFLYHLLLKPYFWLRTPLSHQKNNFFLCGSQLYCKSQQPIKNSRAVFRNIQFSRGLLNDSTCYEEEMYLLIFHEDNIAHFFHDIFFHVYALWRENKKKIFVSLNMNQFQRDFISSAIDKKYLIFADSNKIYAFKKLTLVPEGRNLKIYSEYVEICKEIKYACFASKEIIESRSRNIIYGRNELERKNLLNIDRDFLLRHGLEQVELSKLSFSQCIKLLAETKNFIYMVGAGVFYLLFLDHNVKVLEINPTKNNSWAQMFGLSHLCDLEVLVSKNTRDTIHAMQDDADLDSHVVFDELIERKIKSIL